MKRHLIGLGITLFAMIAGAESPPPPADPQHAWVAPQSAEMQRLSELLVGEWRTTEKFEAHATGAGTGAFSIHKGPGGNSLFLDYTSHSSMGPYSGRRVLYWDKDGRYRSFYCDSLQPVGCGESGAGKWEGKELVFESTTPGPAGTLQMRERFSDIAGDGFTFSLDVMNQGQPERTLTIVARRNSAKP